MATDKTFQMTFLVDMRNGESLKPVVQWKYQLKQKENLLFLPQN